MKLFRHKMYKTIEGKFIWYFKCSPRFTKFINRTQYIYLFLSVALHMSFLKIYSRNIFVPGKWQSRHNTKEQDAQIKLAHDEAISAAKYCRLLL